MNNFLKFVVFFTVLAIGNIIYKLNTGKPIKPPTETWWGLGEPSKEDRSVVPFEINVPDQVLNDLIYRLENHRSFAPPLQGVHHHYGLNTKLLEKIVNFWLTQYDWRSREKFLNKFPQYQTSIQGLKIHFIHEKPKNVPSGVKVVPLLLLHGWPGSVREFYEIMPLLTTPQKDKSFVFEVIAPSLPGYGFSEAAVKPGLGNNNMVLIFKNLMERLGFKKFYVQGGDWGAAIAFGMTIFFPKNVIGVHSNLCISHSLFTKVKLLLGAIYPSLVVDEKNRHKFYPLSNFFSNILLEFGYMHIQATKPDTIGVALTDSPVGLAAYIFEKFIIFTNPEWKNRENGGILEKFTYTKILDIIMIYWVTNSITSSMRIYSESLNKKENVFDNNEIIKVPTACAVFNNEILYQPPSLFKNRFKKLVQVNEYDGGHFPAFEVPKVLAKDIWSAISLMENIESRKKTDKK